ncbi:hypothetical protein LOK49_LG04G01147 [Camellia lanceoleosa]|uniref:Uncharacterized protein n=1 Tax=Camellia lanceoleosa TaxID=1840588 RepID=A0ACC0HZ47_9ERIC|nr:hypothetical protein LOK49_LG04G01147 [Camellia lanceoleosa]
MLRALSTRRTGGGYKRLDDHHEPSVGVSEVKLKRVTSMPAKLFGSCIKLNQDELNFPDNFSAKQVKKVSKIHPIFSLLDTRRKKKATARPEFARYVEYLKEGGIYGI